ncbi:MAG TPA: DUF3540 domain-containing protein [Stellaceae bacterium]|nr:DUF3540 domain-containing protein [Stellaceae bacterium]
MHLASIVPLGTSSPQLGEAVVVAAAPGERPLVRLSDGTERRFTPAFALPYEPAVGDQLLVIGNDQKLYAIGVIAGAGRLSLAIGGDVSLHAIGGSLTLCGDKGVAIEGPNVGIATQRLELVAESLSEMFGNAVRRVRDLFTFQAGESHSFIEGHTSQHSKTAVINAAGTVTVTGEQVHLG